MQLTGCHQGSVTCAAALQACWRGILLCPAADAAGRPGLKLANTHCRCRQDTLEALAAKRQEELFDRIYARFEALQAAHGLLLIEGTHEDGPVGGSVFRPPTLRPSSTSPPSTRKSLHAARHRQNLPHGLH